MRTPGGGILSKICTVIYAWHLYWRVTQNMLRMYEGKMTFRRKKTIFDYSPANQMASKDQLREIYSN